jgi:hypothetical protein
MDGWREAAGLGRCDEVGGAGACAPTGWTPRVPTSLGATAMSVPVSSGDECLAT